MEMATETDLRLRSWLDSNQRDREQLCRSVLALDPHYSDVRPRHPLGGPDNGRDIEAIFDGALQAFGAVGFLNSANDSAQQKKIIRSKFIDDVSSAMVANPEIKAFAFLTNIRLTMGEQNEMKQKAKKAGLAHCDIFDRERLRIELDSPGGFFLRFQYLSIPLSEAEQASFLSKYGTQIQEVVSTGFQKLDKTLKRLLFLAESDEILGTLTFRFVLKKQYDASEIGHYRAFVFLSIEERRPDMFIVWFGSSDRSGRFREDVPGLQKDTAAGISKGISGGQWESYVPPEEEWNESVSDSEKIDGYEEGRSNYQQTSWYGGVGLDSVPAVFARYKHGDTYREKKPRLSFRELDEASYLPFVNASLAEKIHSIQIFANGYKLDDIGPDNFCIDRTKCEIEELGHFTDAELEDPWVRLRPVKKSSSFDFRFNERTPRRIYGFEEPSDSELPPGLR